MDQSFVDQLFRAHQACPDCPTNGQVSGFFQDLLGVLFPDFAKTPLNDPAAFVAYIEGLRTQLYKILYQYPESELPAAEDIVITFFRQVPAIYDKLTQDATAMYKGDPAARSYREVIRTYPGFYAIAAYRMAHALHQLSVEVVPRMITEHAHSLTGIDIHPGAQIGDYFFIDHGTGVVIGETAVIGNRVKMYQGVTLGALSISKEDAQKKRHPTIEDNVVLYAGATILGGQTVIGQNSIVGGNVWITRSIPANTKVYYQAKMYHESADEVDLVVFKDHVS